MGGKKIFHCTAHLFPKHFCLGLILGPKFSRLTHCTCCTSRAPVCNLGKLSLWSQEQNAAFDKHHFSGNKRSQPPYLKEAERKRSFSAKWRGSHLESFPSDWQGTSKVVELLIRCLHNYQIIINYIRELWGKAKQTKGLMESLLLLEGISNYKLEVHSRVGSCARVVIPGLGVWQAC